MGRCVMDLGFFLTLAAALSGNFGIGPGFALADDASRSKAAPAIGANPSSPESIEAGGAAGSWRLVRTATATAAKGEAAILHTADIERSDPRLAGLMLRCRREGVEAVVVVVSAARPAANHLAHAGTRIPIYWNDYFDRRGNSVARRRNELGGRPLADAA